MSPAKTQPIRIAVLASGRGSNFEAILDAVQTDRLNAEIVAVISDQPAAPVLSIARAARIPAIQIPVPALVQAAAPLAERRKLHEEKILEALAPLKPHFLVLAGYMRVLTPKLIEAFRSPRGYSRIVNVHPSLLPAFPGVNSYAQAFEHGTQLAGVTVHLVEEQVDAGPICAQESFSISDCQSVAEVEARGLEVEHRLYPESLRWILPETFAFKKFASHPVAAPVVASTQDRGQHRGGPALAGEARAGGRVIRVADTCNEAPSPQARGRGDNV